MDLPGVDPSRVVTVPHGVSAAFRPQPVDEARGHVRARFGLEREFVLHVGTIEPRKNHLGLIDAFERLRRAGFGGPLVLVGQDGWRTESIRARLASSPESSAMVRVRDATDRDLVALCNACTMFVFPSLEEGFGYPLAEAMACGAPCITSNRSSLVEVAGDAAVQVTPEDAEELAEAMIGLWRDAERRAALAARGPARATHFDRDRWIGRMFEIYRSLLD